MLVANKWCKETEKGVLTEVGHSSLNSLQSTRFSSMYTKFTTETPKHS